MYMAKPLPSLSDVRRVLEAAAGPLHAGQLAEILEVKPKRFLKFDAELHQWAAAGDLSNIGGSRYTLSKKKPERDQSPLIKPKSKRNSPSASDSKSKDSKSAKSKSSESQEGQWEGILSMHAKGFGFVNRTGSPDVFIPPNAIGPALHGDTVLIAITGRSAKGYEGSVLEVRSRRSPRIIATLRRSGKSAWLEPEDARLRSPIALKEFTADGADGDSVLAEIVRFPLYEGENPEAIIIELLGRPGDPATEVYKILTREQVTEEHPGEALEEANRLLSPGYEIDPAPRHDLTHVPFLTIDPEDARDHDDSVWVERSSKGYRVYIAIADVSAYVPEGGAIDLEAIARGCTIYLPTRAIPMLPPILAVDACSLRPGGPRRAMVAIVDLDRSGSVLSCDVDRAWVRPAALITYEAAGMVLGFLPTDGKNQAAETYAADLEVLAELATILRARRMDRGALDLDLPEPKLKLSPENQAPLWIVRRTYHPGIKRAYGLVEEMMLLANECVAQWLLDRNSPAVYRVHHPPDHEKLGRLTKACEALGLRFEEADLQSALGLSQWLTQIKEHPSSQVLEMLTLRSLKQAEYTLHNGGHFGLASEAYLHFTSPIRRYPDLVVHRLVKRLLDGKSPELSEEEQSDLELKASKSSERERASLTIEREVVDLYRALLMVDHIGERFEGTVSAAVGAGLYITLDDPFVDVLVKYEDLGKDRYTLADNELYVQGERTGDRIVLGERIRVEIIDVALFRRAVLGRRISAAKQLVPFDQTEPRADAFAQSSQKKDQRGGQAGNGRFSFALNKDSKRKKGGKKSYSDSDPAKGSKARREAARGEKNGSKSASSNEKPKRGKDGSILKRKTSHKAVKSTISVPKTKKAVEKSSKKISEETPSTGAPKVAKGLKRFKP